MAQLLEHEKASLKGSLKELERDFESTRKKAEELIEQTNQKFPPVMTKVQGVEASVNAVVKQISNLRAGGGNFDNTAMMDSSAQPANN